MTPQQILQKYWNYDNFRPQQADIIESVLQAKDTLALLPTGGGKSICFQVPAMLMEGVCLVVTPLIALMKDQVEQLKKRNIKAAAIYSGMHRNEIDITLDNCIYGDLKFLYISPERLQTDLMRERTKQMKVCLLAIDEAHCVSAWGYDFRPPYLRIAEFRELLPKTPLIALTATATKEVKLDIIQKLLMRNAQVFQQSFARKNLSYSTFRVEDKERKLTEILQNVSGSAIIYVRSRRRTQEIAQKLNRMGISAGFYHAGLVFQERSARQDAWIRGQLRVMVATNAFGMGIDKPDVRVVVHLEIPETLEAYYQEAGRAGRDGLKSYGVALFNGSDLETIEDRTLQKYPPIEFLKRVYQALANYYRLAVGSESFESYDFDLQDFCSTFGFKPNDTHHALKKLEDEGIIQLSDAYYSPARIQFLVDNKSLYDFQLRNPNYEKFTKLLLRIYGGELFGNYVSISESAIAKSYYATQQEVEQMLNYLKDSQILLYEPQRAKPQLVFLTARQDAQYLALNVAEIERKKQQELSKAQAVCRYVQEHRRCRSLMLQEYFDEFSEQECGVCDNCLQRKKQGESGDLRQKYAQILKNKLIERPNSLQEIVAWELLPNKKELTETLRQLLEAETLIYGSDGLLRWSEK